MKIKSIQLSGGGRQKPLKRPRMGSFGYFSWSGLFVNTCDLLIKKTYPETIKNLNCSIIIRRLGIFRSNRRIPSFKKKIIGCNSPHILTKGAVMKVFLRNLGILLVLATIMFVLFPDIMRQVFGLYNGLGILPLIIIMVVISAIPKRKGRRQ